MSGRLRAWQRAAVVVGAACLVVTFGYKLYASDVSDAFGHYVWTIGTVLPTYLVAVWLVRLRPEHPQAQRMLLVGLGSTAGVAVESLVRATKQIGGDPSWLWSANLLHQLTSMLTMCAAGVLIASYPDGTVDRPWQRVAVRLIWWQLPVPLLLVLSQPQVVVSPYLYDTPSAEPDRIENPVGIAALAPLGSPLEIILTAYVPAVLGFAVLTARFARGDQTTRRRTRMLLAWLSLVAPLALGYVALDVAGVPADSPAYAAVGFLFVPVVLMIPVSIVVGVLRHQLFDIELAVRSSVVYAVLVATIALVYAGLAAAPGLALGGSVPVEVAVLSTVVVALLIQPARRRLEAWADRWAFGERVNRYQLMSHFGAGLEQTVDLAALLPLLATTVREGLGASWVRVRLRGDTGWLAEPRGVSGEPVGEPALEADLRHDGEVVGRLECGPHQRGYDDADRELVTTLARQAATAIANVRLAATLQDQLDELARSRARIVAAQDEERRRIERDIHDGVQQQLVALIAKLRLARNRLGRGEPVAEALAEVQGDAGELLVDLRELAHGIHPPVLTDGGLLAAVEARAARLPMAVNVTALDTMRARRFDPDVEAAAYFVVCEALTNVIKHAGARDTTVELTASDARLSLRVRDDGRGTATVNGHGRGLTNLRDRVEALGGRLHIDSHAGAGTSVVAELPLEVTRA